MQRLKGTFDGLRGWNGYGSSSAVKVDEETDDDIVFVNKKCIRFTSSDASAYGTVVQTVMLPAGRTYVFSVYGRAAVTGLGEKPSFWLQAQKEDPDGDRPPYREYKGQPWMEADAAGV